MALVEEHRRRSMGTRGRGVAGVAPPQTKIRVLVPKTLLRLYLTLPVTSATSERTHTFSTLRRLKNYLRSTMKQDRLNKLEQLPTDALSQIDYGHTRQLLKNTKGVSRGMRMAELKMSSPTFQNALRL